MGARTHRVVNVYGDAARTVDEAIEALKQNGCANETEAVEQLARLYEVHGHTEDVVAEAIEMAKEDGAETDREALERLARAYAGRL